MVIVVGGGITGLAAAFELHARGVPVTVLEASPRAGGIIRTEEINGLVIDAGPDSVLAQKPAALTLFDQVGLSDRVISTKHPRTAYVLANDRLHPLPSPSVLGIPLARRAIATYDLLPLAARARLALERYVPRRAPDAEDESVASFFARRFGPRTVDLIAQPLLGGIHAGDVGRLSMRSLFPRFLEAESRYGSVLRAMRAGAKAAPSGVFRSLAGGMEELPRAILRALPAATVRCNSAVNTIVANTNGWQVSAGGDVHSGRAVIVCTPAHTAAGLLSGVDNRVSSWCAEVPYVSSVSVSLAWPADAVKHPLAGSGFVVSRRRSRLRITASTWVSSKWEGRAPAGVALLRGFLGGEHDPGVIDLDDEELVRIAVADLDSVLGIRGAPAFSRVYRWRRASAQHEVGHLARMAHIEARLEHHPGLFVAGSGFRAIGIPDCIADGRAAAARAVEYIRIGG